MNNLRFIYFVMLAIISIAALPFVKADQNAMQDLVLTINSSQSISGVVGEYATITGNVKNAGTSVINDVTSYISILDAGNKLPIDLEDWSAQRSVYADYINPGESVSLAWKIHFITAGQYSLSVLAVAPGYEKAFVSSITHFNVKSKITINTNNALLVSIITPVVILLMLIAIRYRHNKT